MGLLDCMFQYIQVYKIPSEQRAMLGEGEKMEMALRLKFTKGKPCSLQFFYSEEIDSRASMFPFVKPYLKFVVGVFLN